MANAFPLVPEKTALLVVDVQRYFTEPDHPFGRLSSSRIEGGIASYFERLERTVIPHLRSLLRVTRQHTGPIVYTRLGSHLADGSDLPAWARRINESSQQTFGSRVFPSFQDRSSEIDPRVAPEPRDRIVQKTTTGALASTPLASDLRTLGIRSVVVTGVLTPFCVAQTARELADRDFDVAIVQDATASLTETAHGAALAAFEAIYGWVVPTREVVQAMGR